MVEVTAEQAETIAKLTSLFGPAEVRSMREDDETAPVFWVWVKTRTTDWGVDRHGQVRGWNHLEDPSGPGVKVPAWRKLFQ